MINVILKRLFKNASVILTANAVSAVMGLVCISLAARALGAELLGVFAMIQAFVVVIDSLTNFQCWQAVIKFGADFVKQDKKESLASLTKFCTCLDFATAVSGTLISAGAIYIFSRFKTLDRQTLTAAVLFSTWILFNLRGTAVGVLRLNNRFKFIAAAKLISMAAKTAMAIAAFISGAKLVTFAAIWPAAVLIESALLLCGAWSQTDKIYGRSFFKSKLDITAKDKTIWKFVICTNLNQSIRLASREMDVLIVGAVLTTTAAGIYKIARQFALAITQLTEPVYQAIYPELAKLAAEKHITQMKKVMTSSAMAVGGISAAVWIAFLIFGKQFLAIAAGCDYTAAYGTMMVFMGGLIIWAFSFPLPAGLLAVGCAEKNVAVQIISLIVFLPAIYLLLKWFGLIGAGAAQIVFFSCYAVCSVVFFAKKCPEE